MPPFEDLLDQALAKLQVASGAELANDLEGARAGFFAALALLQQAESLTPLPSFALSWQIATHGSLGDLALAHGDLAQARRQFEAKLQLAEQIRAQTGDAPDALRDLSISRLRLGDLARTDGDLAEARRQFDSGLQLAEQIRAQTGDTPVALRDLSISHDRLGDLAFTQGDLAEARRQFESGLELAEEIRAQIGATSAVLRDLSFGHMRLGDLTRTRGDLSDAQRNFEAALRFAEQIRQQTGDTPEALGDLVCIRQRLGDLAFAQGDRAEALRQCEAAVQLAEHNRQLTGDRHEILRYLSFSRLELGYILACTNDDLPEAQQQFDTGLQLAEQVHQQIGDTPQALENLSYARRRLGDLARDHGHLGEARRQFQHQLQLAEQVCSLNCDTPEALRDLSISHDRLGNLAEMQGDKATSAQHRLESVRSAVAAALGRAELSLTDFRFQSEQLTRLVKIDTLSEKQVWPFYAQMREGVMGYTEFNRAESIERARPHIDAFHHAWIGLALDRTPARLPDVLGAAQGRKVTTLVMDELHRELQMADATGPAVVADFWKQRRRVNELSLVLAGGQGSERGQELSIAAHHSTVAESAEAARTRFEALQRSYGEALAAYEAARDALIAERPDLAELKPDPARYRLKTLQAGLQPESALLLLIDAPPDEARPHRAHALFIPKAGDPVLKPLPELDALPAQLHAYRSSLNRGDRSGAYRDCSGWTRAVAEGDAEAPVTPSDAATALKERLWSAFESELQPEVVKHLHVVSHGNLHNLPLSLGAPSGLRVSQYPGLVYYWMMHNRDAGAIVVDTSRPLSAKVYTPQTLATEGLLKGMAPIPHVVTEYALAASCWSKKDELLYERLDGPPATLMHIACHGTLKREGQEDPCLILGPDKALNLLELLNGEKSSPVVYLSACLVGQTKEDVDGDPLGLVGAFMIRGAKVVIAALNPINDFWAPLLAYLFHRTLQAQSRYVGTLAPVEALEDSKRQLMTGNWVPDCVPEAARDAWIKQSKLAVQTEYTNSMATQLQHWEGKGLPLCWGEFSKGLAALMKPLEGLPEVPTTADVGECPLFAALDREANQKKYGRAKTDRTHPIPPDLAQTLAGLVAKQVVDSRTALHRELISVRLLLQDMQAFGADLTQLASG